MTAARTRKVIEMIVPGKMERDELIARMRDIKTRMYAPRDEPLATEELRALNGEFEQVRAAYYDGLPVIAVARCPFCGEIILMAMDGFGLDGPWWDVFGQAGVGDAACRHHLVTVGALDVPETVAQLSTGEIQPGPAVPFVVPRLMVLPGMVCVLHATTRAAEGATAYLMTYFSDPPVAGEDGHQPWLRTQYWYHDDDGNLMWNTRNDAWDFDLAPWLEHQPPKLLWIPPDDADMALRPDAVETCPYLDLPGRRHPVSIRDGRIHDLPLPDGTPVEAGDLFD